MFPAALLILLLVGAYTFASYLMWGSLVEKYDKQKEITDALVERVVELERLEASGPLFEEIPVTPPPRPPRPKTTRKSTRQ